MVYDLMNTGDHVLTITNNFLAIERYEGSIELYPVLKTDNKITLDTDAVTTIGYIPCNGKTETEEYTAENGVYIVNF